MSDENEQNNSLNNGSNDGQVPNSPVVIHRQYLKDLSFENPNAPQILAFGDNRPEMDMNISMDVHRLEHDKNEFYYEVVLTLNANAVRDGKAMFVAEVVYAAALSIDGLDESQHHPLLLVEVPHLIFPYARQLLATVTQSGGFMPLQLRPVDFRSMYLQRFAKKAPENTEE
jgi:preprotein translocase subunit SecB